MFQKVRAVAKEVLVDDELVEKMMPALIFNLDEECLHALGKNELIVGSKAKKKHDNQNASSRYLLLFALTFSHRQLIIIFIFSWCQVLTICLAINVITIITSY